MSKFMILKINNSKDASVKSGKWKDPGAKLYDQLMNACYYEGGVPEDANELDELVKRDGYKTWDTFLKEAYLKAPINKIKNNGPYGITPYSQSGCKYPHHIIRNGELVVHESGLKAAYSRAKQMGIFTGEVKEHLEKHYKELGLYEGSTMAMDEKMDMNFDSIESFIYESTGIDLYSPKELFEEKSQGKLKSSFRYGINPDNGHRIKVVFDLNPNDVKFIGHKFDDGDSTIDTNPDRLKKINKTGNNDFVSSGTVKAIIDEDNGTKLQSVRLIGSLNSYLNNIKPFIEPEGSKIWNVCIEDRGKESFEINTLRLRELIVKSPNWNPPSSIIQTCKIGQKETNATYKATRPGDHAEVLKNMNSDHRRSNFNARGVNVGITKIKNELKGLINEFKIILAAVNRFEMIPHNQNILDEYKRDFVKNGQEGIIHCRNGEVNKALSSLNNCIHEMNGLKKFLKFLKSPKIKKESVNIYQESVNCMNDIDEFIFEKSQINPTRIWAEMNKLPEVYQKLVKDTNKMIIKKMESLIKNNPKYKRLNEKEIIDELKESMINPKVMGVANLHKKSKGSIGSIFITSADQDYDFYHTDQKKYALDEIYKPIYPIYLDMMKEIEKELKSEFEEYKDIGLKFMLRGDPIDQIYEFEFDLSEETAEELWNYLNDKNHSKIFRATLCEESSQYYMEEVSLQEFHEIVNEFKKDYEVPIIYVSGDFCRLYNIRSSAVQCRIDKDSYLNEKKINVLSVDKPGGIKVILITPLIQRILKNINDKNDTLIILKHEYGHILTSDKISIDENIDYTCRICISRIISKYYDSPYKDIERTIGYQSLNLEKMANDAVGLRMEDHIKLLYGTTSYPENPHNPYLISATIQIPDIILHVDIKRIKIDSEYKKLFNLEYLKLFKKILPPDSFKRFLEAPKKASSSQINDKENSEIKDSMQEAVDYINNSENDIYALNRKDVTSPYFVKWLFQTDEFSGDDPEKFNFDILIHNPNDGNFVYGYYTNNLDGIIRVQYRKDEDYYAISMLFVNSKIQGSGIGQKLLKFAIDKFGDKKLKLNVFTFNKRAIHIYKKYGFQIEDTIKVEAEPGEDPRFVGKKMYRMIRLGKQEEGLKMESADSDDLGWIEKYLTEEGEENPQQPVEEKKPPEPEKKESMPKKTDRAESDKNGVRRKQLYIAFIEWAKAINPKNTFGSIFDKDAFHSTYPFVPEEMRYFYRLANPMLCVLTGDLTFFAVAELKKLNIKNSRLSEMMIFAATKEDVRVFNKKDKKVYRGVEENGMLKLAETLGDTYDTYIQKMINKGDILNAPLQESVDMLLPLNIIGRRT
jgi:ribosomal protein S18 acetylase RimI-like enzyme